MPVDLVDIAQDVLQTENAVEKARKTHKGAEAWRQSSAQQINPPQALEDRPARPAHPELRDPADMPKRKKAGSARSRIALLHALAHIELNAIDLAWDIIARYAHLYEADEGFSLPIEFYLDWLKVAEDEAKHFLLLNDRLADFNAAYGDLPAHDGLWESALLTKDDFAARLAIVPMVLEARGLDVTPHMIQMMKKHADYETAAILKIIHDDEITHVRAGTVWFDKWCDDQGLDGEAHWQNLVKKYFRGQLKRPFNHDSRDQAGMVRDWYEPLADIDLKGCYDRK